MSRRTLILVSAALVLAGCSDEREPTAPPARPNAQITDGANGIDGNRDFFFLPPLVKNPSGKPGFGDDPFDPTYSPIVEICPLSSTLQIADGSTGPPLRLPDGRCDNSVAVFSGAQISVSTADQLYQVNWNTGTSNLSLSTNYRIRVLIGNVELGHADVDPMSKNAMQDLATGELIQLVDGRTLPINFRIERNALTTADDLPGGRQFVEQLVPNVGTNGGTVVVTDPTNPLGGAFFPDGWLDGQLINGQQITQVTVTIEELRPATPAACHPGSATQSPSLLQFGKCFRYSTVPKLAPLPRAENGQQFAQAVIVGFCSDLPASAPQYDALRVYQSETGVEDAPRVLGATPYPQFVLNCSPPPVITGTLGPMEAGWRRFASAVGRLLGPTTAYAVDLGIGGQSFDFSDFNFGLVPTISAGTTNPTTGTPGSALAGLTFRVTAPHDGVPANVPVPGVSVALSVTTGNAMITGTASPVTSATGDVAVPLTLGANPGLVIVRASILSNAGTQVAFDTITIGTAAPSLPSLALAGLAALDGKGSSLLLTPGAGGPFGGGAGAAWYATPLPLSGGFTTTFTFRVDGPGDSQGTGVYTDPVNPTGGGDGFAFVIQSSLNPTSAIGGAGGSLGYGGITNSLAVEFDTWDSDDPDADFFDPNANHIAIHSAGAAANSPLASARIGDAATPAINLSDAAEHTAKITYTPPTPNSTFGTLGTLTVTLDGSQTPVLTRSVTLGLGSVLYANGTAHVGFTAATGRATENHRILSWTLPTSP